MYEYKEEMKPEETKKNPYFGPVENYGYELPEDFEDKDVSLDEEEDEEDKHSRMLKGINRIRGEAFDGDVYIQY